MDFDRVIHGTGVEPRPYQQRIVTKAVQMFEGRYQNGASETEPAARSVMVESPTGSGKTVMGLLAAKWLQQRHGVHVGWVAMRRNLLKQTAAENERHQVGVSPIAFISMFDKQPPAELDLLIVDEAQHDAASSMAHLHNVIKPRWILGLTATPFRTDRIKLCFDKVIKDAGIHQLIQDGYLSEYDHYTIPNFDVATVAEFYLREPARWGKSIFFFLTLNQCEELGTILRAAGVRCEVVTGGSDRDTQIERFRAGEVTVLINCMVLTEGFDAPDLQTVFCRDSAKGPTMQMCGRAFRKHPSLDVKNIVQSKLTKWPFTKVAKCRTQYLWQEDTWRTLTVNPKINLANTKARMAVASTEVELPKFLKKHAAPPRHWNW